MATLEEDDPNPEWEQEEEPVPPSLEKKWREEEAAGHTAAVCKSCGREVPGDALLCLFCGESTGIRVGLFSRLKAWALESFVGVLFLTLLVAALLGFFVMAL